MRGKVLFGAFVVLALLICGGLWVLLPPAAGSQAYLEKELGITLPQRCEIAQADTHGGFHGDGVLLAVAELGPEGAAELAAGLSSSWQAAPVEEEVLQAFQGVWSQYAGALGSLPEGDAGPWLFRDRYREKYGEVCRQNPLLQNSTFALLDLSAGRLYVVEVDC